MIYRKGRIICNSRNVDREIELLRALSEELGTIHIEYGLMDDLDKEYQI